MDIPHIALVGKTRSGKDQVYQILAQKGLHVQRVAFGDAMKEKFYELFPQYVGLPKPTGQIIHFGQSMRVIDEDVWIKLALNAIRVHAVLYDQYGIEPPSYVFTDVRQANELKAVKQLGAVVVKVEASPEVRVRRMRILGETPTQEVLHANTETDLDSFDYDYLIKNNGTHGELETAIDNLLIMLQNKPRG